MTGASPDTSPQWDFFLVHSSRAKARARELHDVLLAEGARPFLDAEHLQAGSTWDESLDDALRRSRIAVILVSESFDSAFYAGEEITVAINCFRRHGTPVVIPVYLDGISPGDDAPYGLNRLHSLAVAQGEDMAEVATRLMARLRQTKAAPATGASTPTPTSPNELVVDWKGSETYRSIQQALNDAEPGSTVRIRPGVYNESLTITKPVHLVGDGSIDKIILQSFNSTTITLASDGGSLRGLTVRQKGGTFPYQAIDIASGLPHVEGCIISGGAHSSIRIRGNATPTVQRNIIEGTARHGVELGDHASAQLLDNWIDAMAADGVWIGGHAHAVVRGNAIDDCVGSGVHLVDNARVSVQDNLIRRCGDGMTIEGRSYATVAHNTISKSRQVGLRLREESSGIFTRNRITRSELFQVDVCTAGTLTMEENVVTGGRLHGIRVSVGWPTFARNVISENQWAGVFVDGAAGGVFYENLIARNTGPGICFVNSAAGQLRLNIVEGNGDDGVFVNSQSTDGSTIEQNHIWNNDGVGVNLSAGTMRCKHNLIERNRLSGMHIGFWNGPVEIVENDVSSQDDQGAVDDPGILVQGIECAAPLTITGNRVHRCTVGIDLQLEYSSADVNVTKNFIDDNTEVGVRLAANADTSGTCYVAGNRLAGNATNFEAAGSEQLDVWVASNTDDVHLGQHLLKLRTLGFLRRLEKLDPETGEISLELRRLADRPDGSPGAGSLVPSGRATARPEPPPAPNGRVAPSPLDELASVDL